MNFMTRQMKRSMRVGPFFGPGWQCKMGFHDWDEWEFMRTTGKGEEMLANQVASIINALGYSRRTCLRCNMEQTAFRPVREPPWRYVPEDPQ